MGWASQGQHRIPPALSRYLFVTFCMLLHSIALPDGLFLEDSAVNTGSCSKGLLAVSLISAWTPCLPILLVLPSNFSRNDIPVRFCCILWVYEPNIIIFAWQTYRFSQIDKPKHITTPWMPSRIRDFDWDCLLCYSSLLASKNVMVMSVSSLQHIRPPSEPISLAILVAWFPTAPF